MSRFWAGFGVSTALWVGALAYLHLGLGFAPPAEEPAPLAAAPLEDEPVMEEEEVAPRRRRRRRRARHSDGEEATPTGTETTGDDLGEDEARTVDMGGSGGEEQLSPAQIEASFDAGMGGIRRCLVLMAGEDAVTGRLTFGVRVAGSGEVRAVNLSGPRAATTGEAGSCLRAAARRLHFDSFDGPEMVARYQILLE